MKNKSNKISVLEKSVIVQHRKKYRKISVAKEKNIDFEEILYILFVDSTKSNPLLIIIVNLIFDFVKIFRNYVISLDVKGVVTQKQVQFIKN